MRSRAMLLVVLVCACGDPSDEPEDECPLPGGGWVVVDAGSIATGDVVDQQGQNTRICLRVEW